MGKRGEAWTGWDRIGACAVVALAAAASTLVGCGSGAHTEPGYTLLSGGGGAAGSGGADSGAPTSSSRAAGSGAGGGGGPSALGPPYPIVLAHGFFGFEKFAGLDFATYFYQVRDHLAAHGEELVFTPAVDPFNDSAFRGAQLAEAIEDILSRTGHAKVNIVGHSQGGLDARVVAHDHPERVASVVTLQTPHAGTPIADIALELVSDPNLQGVLDFLVQAVGTPLYDQVNNQTSLVKPLELFSAPGIAAFNASYPDRPGIYYGSIAGRSDWHFGGTACDAPARPSFVSDYDSELDPIDPMFDITEMILDGGLTNPYPNDGLVRVVDAKHGEFLGCLPADHLDMVGHLFGDDPGLTNDWDYRQFYVELVAFLRQKGF